MKGEVGRLFDLTGRTALVTGGSRGLGLQVAEVLGDLGARIVISARSFEELATTSDLLKNRGIAVEGVPADASKDSDIEALADKAIETLAHVDILVNNAGASWGALAEDHPIEAWDKVFNLNVRGLFLLTQRIGKRSMMPRNHGRIINMASIAGLVGNAPGTHQTIAYNTSKGAVVNFTRALAAEWGPRGITVNAIAPGFFPSKMSNGVLRQIGDRVLQDTPLGRLGGDEDLKGAVALFASEAGRHITGQIL